MITTDTPSGRERHHQEGSTTWFAPSMLALADRTERGAAALRAEAANAAEVLAGRANGELADPVAWAKRKLAAAEAAEAHAAEIRTRYANGGRASETEYRAAERVATAAECGGILIDGALLAEASAERAWSAEEAAAIRDHQQDQEVATAASGRFKHVAEPGQVPFWQLGGSS